MKAIFPVRVFLPAILVPLAFSSCGTMKVVTAAKEKTAATMSKVADASVGRIMGPKVKVVEVREKDLKEIPTGQERALAFENRNKKRGSGFFSFFNGPVDFKEPTLPSGGAEIDGSLLPPIE